MCVQSPGVCVQFIQVSFGPDLSSAQSLLCDLAFHVHLLFVSPGAAGRLRHVHE